ncbi:hypothetical protein MAPG_07781 [Magnaporthiopsis poae ATCC 64411]|uniref:Uncharacterized protein n=1 Tax=Magnaporthiopsis poae (strain ATCC 64411 / 73-15) TaxID=644358 RepID=A0A0C4E5K9_MAGP6|nr:hypothetical protein MAPG_07781 [Magnaporthiopsis poae ATCC 64411]
MTRPGNGAPGAPGPPEWARFSLLASFRGRLVNMTGNDYKPLQECVGASENEIEDDEAILFLELFEKDMRELFWTRDVEGLAAVDTTLQEDLIALCRLLDKIVNTDLLPQSCPVQGPGDYQNFDALLQVLQSSKWTFQLATGPGARIFRTKSADLAEAASDTVQRIVCSVVDLCQASLRDLAAGSLSIPDLGLDIRDPDSEDSRGPDSASQALDAFLRIISRMNRESCGSEGHKVMVQLTDLDINPGLKDRDLNLFLSTCHDLGGEVISQDTQVSWQEAQLVVLNQLLSSGQDDWETAAICAEVRKSFCSHGSRGLRLAAQDNCILVFSPKSRWQRHTGCFISQWPCTTLKEKLAEGAFVQSLNDLRPPEGLFGPHEKRMLAARLVLSLYRSLFSSHIALSWDSAQVFFLSADKGVNFSKDLCFVLCETLDCDQASSTACTDREEAFRRLAKLLLEIESGYNYDKIVPRGQDALSFNKRVSELIGQHVGLKPYLETVEVCHNFMILLQDEDDAGSGAAMKLCAEIVQRIRGSPLPGSANEGTSSKAKYETLGRGWAMSTSHNMYDRPAPPATQATCTGQPTRVVRFRPENLPIQPPQVRPHSFFDGEAYRSSENDKSRSMDFFGKMTDFLQQCETYKEHCESTSGREPPEPKIRVAVLDTGINKEHASIRQGFQKGIKRMSPDLCRSWIGNPADIHDTSNHGTNVADVLRRIAPFAEVCVAKIFKDDTFDIEQARNISKAIDHAVHAWQVDIICMSFCVDKDDITLREVRDDIEDAIERHSSRCLFFAAAGNKGRNQGRCFPAASKGVFCVHACD